MKKIAVTIIASAMAFSAAADYVVNVATPGYFEGLGGTGDLSTPFLPNLNDTALVQLYWVGGNGTADNLGGNTLNPGGIAGDDELIGSFTFLNDGAIGNEQYAPVNDIITGAPAYYPGADVFARIFNTIDASAGSYYYEGTIQQVASLDPGASPPPLPAAYDLGLPAVNVAFGLVVPEPATIGLMGIAGLGMFLARRKTRR